MFTTATSLPFEGCSKSCTVSNTRTGIVDDLQNHLTNSCATICAGVSNDVASKPEAPVETKNILEDDGHNYSCKLYNNGVFVGFKRIMPSIAGIEILGSEINDPRCIKLYFEDGTFEKAVTSKNDTFNLEHGISVCITKKLLSMICGGHGNSIYNKIIKDCLDVVAHGIAEQEYEKHLAQEEEERNQRRAAKRARKAERRAEAERKKKEAEREEYIKTQVEIQIRVAEELLKKCDVNLESTDIQTTTTEPTC